MNTGESLKELIVLVPDSQLAAAMEGILSRAKALAIREFKPRIVVHPSRDPGCLNDSHEFLRPFIRLYGHALVIFDHHGCGREKKTREDLEIEVEARLRTSGWAERARAIVIDPELEAWVWSDSPHVPKILGWESGSGASEDLRQFLSRRRFLVKGQAKPTRPKEAMEEILRVKKKPRSSAIYRQLAQIVSLDRCQDSSFLKLRGTLSAWFALK